MIAHDHAGGVGRRHALLPHAVVPLGRPVGASQLRPPPARRRPAEPRPHAGAAHAGAAQAVPPAVAPRRPRVAVHLWGGVERGAGSLIAGSAGGGGRRPRRGAGGGQRQVP